MHHAHGNKITIIQPYVPKYRVPLFQTLSDMFEADGLELEVVHPPLTDPGQSARGDQASAPWSRTVPEHRIRVAGRRLQYRNTVREGRRSRAIVAELASTNLDTYVLAIQNRTPLILWGHGRPYVSDANAIDQALELWLAKRAARVLTYTRDGADHLHHLGVSNSKITAVLNSTDTAHLRQLRGTIEHAEVEAFRVTHGIHSSNVALFVGALDPSKKLELLLGASTYAQEFVPDHQIVIAGEGPLEGMVSRWASTRSHIIRLPHADERTLALLSYIANFCIIPGRVGLVAVDSLALGLPVLTTDWPYHGPEFQYLNSSVSWVTAQRGDDLGRQMVSLFRNESAVKLASEEATKMSLAYSIEAMAERMYTVVSNCI